MNPRTFVASILTLVVASASHAAQDRVVACDLVDEQAAAKALGATIKQHQLNRQTHVLDNASVSTCIFIADRSNLKAQLSEYQSVAEASEAFGAITQGGIATTQPEARLGDKGVYFAIGKEASGYIVLKGKRIFLLDSRWKDSRLSEGSKERLRPVAEAAIRGL